MLDTSVGCSPPPTRTGSGAAPRLLLSVPLSADDLSHHLDSSAIPLLCSPFTDKHLDKAACIGCFLFHPPHLLSPLHSGSPSQHHGCSFCVGHRGLHVTNPTPSARWHRGTLVSLEILEDVLLREISWTQKDKHCTGSLTRSM